MADAKESAIAELRAIVADKPGQSDADREATVAWQERRELYAAVAGGLAPRGRFVGAFDTGRREPIDPPPCWLPPVA